MMGKKPPRQFGFDNRPPTPPPTRWSELLGAVDELIDFEPVRRMAKPHFADVGRPSIDPVMMFKIMLTGFLLGIPSDRRLVEECADRASVRAFLGLGHDDDLPSHSSLTHWRQRLGPGFFRQMLHEIVGQCEGHGMTLSGARTIDATEVKAQASKDGPTVEVPGDAGEVDEFVDRVFKDDLSDDSDEPDDGAAGASGASGGDTTPVNTHDPDARLQRKTHGIAEFRYNSSFWTDVSSGLIIDATATAFERAETILDHLWNDPGPVTEIVADLGYDSGPVLQAALQCGVTVYLPPAADRSRGMLDKSLFAYIPDRDLYICPAGNELKRSRDDTQRRQTFYTALQSDCRACPLKDQCTTASRRSISRMYTERARNTAVRCGPRYEALQRQRRIDEHLHMLAKRDHAMSRARSVGLDAMKSQAAGTAMAINLKRLVKFMERQGSPSAQNRQALGAFLCLFALLAALNAHHRTHRIPKTR